MSIPQNVAKFWRSYYASAGGVDSARFYEAFYFGDNEEQANSLANLVQAGAKRATTSAVWSFEARGKRLPIPGDLSIVTDWAGTPLCIIETTQIDVMPFCEVSAEFAALEYEGDGSLDHWRLGHREYFSRECARAGRVFTENMLVACERFSVVFQAPGAA
jgi:uncharacterized protein YhfF